MASAAWVQEEDEEEEEVEEGFQERAEACEPSVALQLVAAASWHVVRERHVHSFPRVLALLEAVGEAAPDLVHFRHFVKVRLGLQAKVIMAMLQEEQPHEKVYEAMDRYFPEREPEPHPEATARDLALVREAQENFRDLVFGLLRDPREREKYVQEHLENDYGEAFLRVVEDLFFDYLAQLESVLPEPNFQQLLVAASLQGPGQAPQPNSNILSQYLTVMGYQVGGPHVLPPSPSQSSSPFQSEEEEEEDNERPKTPEPCKVQTSPGRPRRGRSGALGAQGEDPDGHHADSSGTDEDQDMVLDSSSEGSGSPFRKDDYQCTEHNTLIPTFQEHLRDVGNRCCICLAVVASPAV
uniref:TERF1-interacting nuclear factor 2 isoform X1 n=2 Tax=Pogona vitticeps TaxID=103695 RepID=A0A6J0V1W3_9SAUR